jgi:hypothetical protein
MIGKKTLAAVILLSAFFFASGCAAQSPAAPAAPETAPSASVTALDQSNAGLTDADLAALYGQTGLISLDLRGNDLSPDAVAALSAALPGCEILWSVPLGSARFDSDSRQIVLPADTTAAELGRLQLFSNLQSVDATALSDAAAVKAASAELPGVSFLWTVVVLGQPYPSSTEALDLTGAQISDETSLVESLAAFPSLKTVDLTGQVLTEATMLTLTQTLPDTRFLWDVDLYGVTVSSGSEEADISGIPVADLTALKQKLTLLPDIKQLVMCNCGPSNEEMAALAAEVPGVKFVWMIRVGGWEMRTDVKAFSKGNRTTFDGGKFIGGKTGFSSEDLEPLKYCTDLIALDVGHGHITDLSILQYLPKLRFLIVALNDITSIEDLKYCPELEYLETFQNFIADWTPLLSLPKLTHLNCSTNYGKTEDGARQYPDYTVLKQMTQLQRLWVIHDNLSKAQMEDLRAALPNAVINNFGTHSTSNDWRDNALYREMQALFNLPISE